MMIMLKKKKKLALKFGGDPLLKLKSRELDLKAKADQEKAEIKKQD